MHGETGNAELPAFRLLTPCNGEQCTATEPPRGAVDTIGLVDTPLGHGAATAIVPKRGVETVPFENAAVAPDGTFATGPSGARIQGGFHGPRPRRGGGHLRAIRPRRSLRRDAAAGARSAHCRRRRAAETPAAGLLSEYDDTGIGQGYPRKQRLTVGEIIDGARFKTPGAAGRVDRAALPRP